MRRQLCRIVVASLRSNLNVGRPDCNTEKKPGPHPDEDHMQPGGQLSRVSGLALPDDPAQIEGQCGYFRRLPGIRRFRTRSIYLPKQLLGTLFPHFPTALLTGSIPPGLFLSCTSCRPGETGPVYPGRLDARSDYCPECSGVVGGFGRRFGRFSTIIASHAFCFLSHFYRFDSLP